MNRDLLEEVYLRYGRELYLYLYAFCKNKMLAEDLLQDVFLAAMVSLRDDHENFKAWLYRVARNMFLDRMRKKKKEAFGHNSIEILTNNELAPLDQYLASERDRSLYQALLQLSEIQRQVIFLQYFAELAQVEIGKILGISHANVRVISYRAKRNLKEKLEGSI